MMHLSYPKAVPTHVGLNRSPARQLSKRLEKTPLDISQRPRLTAGQHVPVSAQYTL